MLSTSACPSRSFIFHYMSKMLRYTKIINYTKMSSHALGKKGKWLYCKHLCYVFRFLCKVDYESDKFIHAPT
jgi:hypothetical protein